MIVLTLPFPPSVNAIWRSAGRVIKSERYRIWQQAAGWDILQQKQKPIKGWYTLTIVLYEADKKSRDPDNFCKAISDILVKHGLIEDDCLCASLHVERMLSTKARAGVIVRESNGRGIESAIAMEAAE